MASMLVEVINLTEDMDVLFSDANNYVDWTATRGLTNGSAGVLPAISGNRMRQNVHDYNAIFPCVSVHNKGMSVIASGELWND